MIRNAGARRRWTQVAGLVVALSIAGGLNATAAVDDMAVQEEGEKAGATINLAKDDNIEAGNQIYHKNCTWYCHGPKGAAYRSPALRNRPDLTAHKLYWTIANGRKRAGKVMPPWKGRLSEDEIWQLIAYVISLRDAPPLEAGEAAAPGH